MGYPPGLLTFPITYTSPAVATTIVSPVRIEGLDVAASSGFGERVTTLGVFWPACVMETALEALGVVRPLEKANPTSDDRRVTDIPLGSSPRPRSIPPA